MQHADAPRAPTQWLAPIALGVLLLGALVLGVSRKAHTATDYPRSDAMQYFVKAKNVFDAVSSGHLAAIMDAPVVYRPPGSSILLYPFGFSPSYRSFYSRTVSVPIILWVTALFLSLRRFATTPLRRLSVIAICSGACSLPLFLQFQTDNPTSVWGLIDPLFASLAALATACLVEGAAHRNRLTTLAGWLAACLSLLVKPAGLLVLAACFGVWGVECLIRLRAERDRKHNDPSRFSYELQSLLLCAVTYVACLAVCLRSQYLTSANIAFFMGGSRLQVQWMSGAGLLTGAFLRMLQASIGRWFLLPLGCVILVAAWRTAKDACNLRVGANAIRGASILILLSAAAYWWGTMAGPQNRYFYPFLLIALLWAVRSIAAWLVLQRNLVQCAAIGYCATPTLAVIGMLWMPHPPARVQALLGVDLTTSLFVEETRLAERLLQESASLQRPVWVSIVGSVREAQVIAPFEYEYGILGDRQRIMAGVQLCDWLRDPGVRVDELERVDFLLCDKEWIGFHPARDSPVRGYHQEIGEFCRFLTGPSPRGIELFHEGTMAAYRVVNRRAFRMSLRAWAGTVRWENGFAERNPTLLAKQN
jgi:hypothetical protein